MAMLNERFTQEALDEVFPLPAIREVAFEVRFAPRLRVNAELWKLQDQLVDEYPNTGTEAVIMQPGAGVLNVSVFQNPSAGRVIKVSQENLLIAFTSYTRFEDFKAEAISKTQKFCSTFEISGLTRAGLRYVNNITLPRPVEVATLLQFVRPLIDSERFDVTTFEQFITEVRMRYSGHMVTLRSALLPPLEDGRRIYVLDIDCHSEGQQAAHDVEAILDRYHDTAQRFFLDHITEDYKNVMRGRP
jgi:uncharacterized protein (TIGR04255 family)